MNAPISPSRKPRGSTGQRRGLQGEQAERAEPRLPHERDESSDSQDQQGVRDVIRQGHDDLARGLQDTDRGPPLDEAYEKQKGRGVPGTAPADPDRSGAGVRKGR